MGIFDKLFGKKGSSSMSSGTQHTAPIKSIKLTENGDGTRGISVALVALRWDYKPISKQELRNRAAKSVQVVDRRFDKEVMDVKILTIDEKQQYVQLSVRANFRDKSEEERMREDLKNEFIK